MLVHLWAKWLIVLVPCAWVHVKKGHEACSRPSQTPQALTTELLSGHCQEEKNLSMGYGFLEFETAAQAQEVLKKKQGVSRHMQGLGFITSPLTGHGE